MSLFKHLSVKWKIYLIALVSVLGFGAYLAFNMWVNTGNAKLLSHVRDASFPILERASANRVKLDRITELLNSAVLTGETEYIATASSTAASMQKNFDKIAELSPKTQPEILVIKKSFDDFFTIAKKIAEDMSQGTADMNTIAETVEGKEKHLTTFSSKLDEFIENSKSNFSGSIETANNNSKHLLTSGFVIWIVNILIISLTVFAIAKVILGNINNVANSLNNLASEGGNASEDIEVTSHDEIGNLAESFNKLMGNLREKTNDLMCMMHNMHQGLFTITDKETIHREYSSYIEQIFSTTNVSGRDYADLLFSSAHLGSDTLNQIKTAITSLLGSDEMMFEFNKHLLISEYSITIDTGNGPTTKIIELDWDPIVSHGEITKIMVTARDVTELKIIQRAAEEGKKELKIVGEILKASPEKFQLFSDNAFKLIDQNIALVKANPAKNEDVIANLFVNMHTIKGNARTYNFSFITDVVHETENVYDRLRKEADYEWDAASLLADLDEVKRAVSVYTDIKQEKLSFADGSASIDPNSVNIDRSQFNSLLAEVNKYAQESSGQNIAMQLERRLSSLDSVPFEKAIEELTNSLPSIAKQLEKQTPQVIFSGVPTGIRREHLPLVNDVFTHLLRNSMDHGIESPDERVSLGKKPEGTIRLDVSHHELGIQLSISDDGRGINLKRIKEKALESGKLSEADGKDPQKVANCLFLSGLSTAEKITAISGRGVGMDAVKKYLEQNNCAISIELSDLATASTEGYAAFSLKLILNNHIAVTY